MTTTEIKNKVSNMQELKDLLKDKQVSGYIWMVEEKEPYVYNNKIVVFDNLNTTGNPYNKIQEAYLTDNEHSIHIKNIDGEEKVFAFACSDFESDKVNYKIDKVKAYPSHINNLRNSGYNGIKNLHFKQVYQLRDNEISKGFQTWQPVVKLFTGLTLKKN